MGGCYSQDMKLTAPYEWEGRPSWAAGDAFVADVGPKTLHAWEVWDFTLDILFVLQHSDFDAEHPEWRIYWLSGVVALRAVGHTLGKVDVKKSDKHQRIINSFWSSMKADKTANWIFLDFIEQERNNILKEFSFGAELPGEEDGRRLAYNGTHLDGVELYREGVYWWRAQLKHLERAIAS